MLRIHHTHKLLCAALSVALSGCATGILPIEPKYDRDALLSSTTTMPDAVNVTQARKIAAAWSDQLNQATRDRRMQSLAAKEVLFYGTLLFTAGSIQVARQASESWRLVRNLGAGAAAGSELLGSHYQTNDQTLAFKRAASQMSCLIEALQPIPANDEYFNLFNSKDKESINAKLTISPKDLDELYNTVPRKTLHFMEQEVLPRLQAELQSIQLGTPSRDALTQMVDRYKAAQQSGTAGAGSVTAPSQQALSTFNLRLRTNKAGIAPLDESALELRRKEVVTTLSTFSAQVDLCVPK
ncbi:MAG: hypothetical protein U5L74_12940 [Ideonella sp.]|nr:hypothetical protein [Ideonella sp.]